MARFKKGQDIDQAYLLPPSVRDWLPDDHLAWFIEEAVESLDIDPLLDVYRQSGKGELPYDPRMMLRVLIYAYCSGVFSSRKIATQLRENIAFRVLAQNQMPSHRSICRFRERHISQFSAIFVQVVRIAAEAGLVKIGKLAIDGSKLKANASKRKAMSYGRMLEEEARLEREVAAILKLATDEDAEEDEELGPDFRGDELPEELRLRETRLREIRAARDRLEKRKAEEALEAEAKEKADDEEKGRKPRKKRPGAWKHEPGKPKPKDQENFTDPDSRIMKDSKGFEQCYNAQVASDGKSRLIVCAAVTNRAADNADLQPMIVGAMENVQQPVNRVLADAGYRSEDNFNALEVAGIDGYISIGREGSAKVKLGKGSEASRRMQRKLRTKRGRTRYRERKHLVEPVFGWLKSVLGFRAFSLRGLEKVSGEFSLISTALNLRRMKALLA